MKSGRDGVMGSEEARVAGNPRITKELHQDRGQEHGIPPSRALTGRRQLARAQLLVEGMKLHKSLLAILQVESPAR